jgi:hypothetical protein
MKISPIGAKLLHADRLADGRTKRQAGRQTDMTKLIVAFSNFAYVSVTRSLASLCKIPICFTSIPLIAMPCRYWCQYWGGKANLKLILINIGLFLARQSTLDQGLLIHEVSRSHTTTQYSRQSSSGRVISSSQRLLPDNTHNRQTSMPPVEFEPTIAAGERP